MGPEGYYLGDGVYVTIYLGMLKLVTMRDRGVETIYLNTALYHELQRFAAQHEMQGEFVE